MRSLRILTSFLVLVPFLFSVSGILIVHSYCLCTDKRQVTFYLPPENCSDVMNDHNHLFEFHSKDLFNCCGLEDKHIGCKQADGCRGCGCESPDAQFFKLINQFTEGKISLAYSLIVKDLPETLLFKPILKTDLLPGVNIVWLKSPPTKLSEHNLFLHLICRTKIPSIA